MAQTGLGKGLAVRHDFGADINRLYQTENLKSQIDVEKRRKAQMYGEMLKGTHVRGKYNTGRLEEYYKEVNNEFANFVTENPGWETDPGLFAKASSISDQYLNNDIVREDEQVAQSFQALQQKMAGGDMLMEDVDKQMDSYSNYIENGGDPYVFINPKKIEYNDILKESASQLTYKQEELRFPTASGVTGSKTQKRVKDASINAMVQTDFNTPGYERAITNDWQKSGGTAVAETPQLFHENNLRAQSQESESKRTYDQLDLLHERSKMSGQGTPTPSAAKANVHEPWWAFRDNYLQTDPSQRAEVEKAFNERQQPNQDYLAFTQYEATGGYASLTPSDRVLFSDGTPMNYTFNQTKAISGGKQYSKNGQLYIETNVEFSIPTTDELKLAESIMDKGFEIVSEEASGFDPNSIMSGKKGKTNTYSGKIYLPAIMEAANTEKFDDAYYGLAEERRGARVDAQGSSAQTALVNSQLIETLNTSIPGFGVGTVEGEFIISADRKTKYNPKTDLVHTNE